MKEHEEKPERKRKKSVKKGSAENGRRSEGPASAGEGRRRN